MMKTIQLFLNIIKQGSDSAWHKHLTSALKNYCATEQVEIVGSDEACKAQLYISYELQNASLNEIELLVAKSGASINGVNIHLPTSVTGFADPYHASAVSLPLEENLKKIKGVLAGGISSNGEIRFGIDTSIKDKQKTIEEVLKILPLKKNNF